jgi:hypothetical protein
LDGIYAKFNAAGQMLSQSTFAGGLMHGAHVVFNAAGEVSQSMMFAEGKLQGGAAIFGEGGIELHRLSFHAGELHGVSHFLTEGKVTAEIGFHAGLQEGLSKMYNLQGKLLSATHFHLGLQHGLHVMFDAATGAVTKAETYVNGALSAKGELEAHLEGGVMMAGEGAFKAGLAKADSLVGKVKGGLEGGLGAAAGLEAEAEVHVSIGGGLQAAAAAALGAGAHLEGLASAALSTAASLAGAFGIDGGVFVKFHPSATIMDHISLKNIRPFCLCKSMSNPAVAAATAANKGVLTPMPCIPMTVSPWIPGAPTVTYNDNATLDHTSKLMCAWAGVITVTEPGQTTVTVP